MERRITGFHQDDERHWVAELECGHAQHLRHDPPWQLRQWVLSEASRHARLGTTLNCVICSAENLPGSTASGAIDTDALPLGLSLNAQRAYLDARLQGLCHDGALEVALDKDRVTPREG